MGRFASENGSVFTTAPVVPAKATVRGTAARSEGERSYLAPTVFSTEGLPSEQQFDAWYGRCGPLIALQPMPRPVPGFPASNVLWDLGSLALSSVVAPGVHFERSPAALRQVQMDHWMIAYSRRGTTTIRTGELTVTVTPGVPFICSLGRRFDGERTDLDWSALFLPRDGFGDLAGRLDAAHGVMLDFPRGLLLADFLRALEARLPSLTWADLPGVEAAIRAVLAASLPYRGASDAPAPEPDVARRERVRRLVGNHLASVTLGPRTLCRLAGISRSTLYRLFENEGGVANYIQRLRLRTAYAALTNLNETRPIQMVAEQVGFVDASVFSRAFRQAFGCSPRDVRAAALAGAPLPSAMPRAPARPSDLVTLLRQL